MKRLRIIGLSLLALFALGALMASSASAVEGVLPLNKKGFTLLSKLVTFATADGTVIDCLELKGTGKFENDHHGTMTLDHLGCTVLGFLLFSLGEKEPKEHKEALILESALFLICLIDSAKLLFGIFVETTETVHLIVSALGLLVLLKGGLIGDISPNKGKLLKLEFKGKEGKQEVGKECVDEKGGKKTNTLLVSKDDGKTFESASENIEGGLAQFEEEVELMDK